MKNPEHGTANNVGRRLVLLCSACVAPLLVATPALAQQVEQIVVTGSRVITNGNNSPTPITVVTVDEVQKTKPGTLADQLNQLPVFFGSQSPFSGGNPTPAAGGNSQANQLALRNLGTLRTLTLLDGHRLPSSSGNGQVDVDMVPSMLIQRADIVTAGASAVYGSDAVAGVVNMVTDTKFNGLKFDARAGRSDRGDDDQQSIGFAAGRKLGSRGHVEFSYQYQNDEGVPFASSRDWHNAPGVIGAGTAASPLQRVKGVRLASQPFGGVITGTGLFVGQTFITDGVLAPLVRGTPTNSANADIGGGGAVFDGMLKAGLKEHHAYSRFDYDLSDSVHAYAVAGYAHKLNNYYSNQSNFGPGTNLTFSTQNPYLPQSVRDAFAAAGQTTFRMNTLIGGNRKRQHENTTTDVYLFNAGLEGSFHNFDWGLLGSYGHSKLKELVTEIAIKQPLYAALDAVVNPATGQIVCRATLTGHSPGCVPLNPFGPTAASQAALNYVDQSIFYKVYNKMTEVSAYVRNQPFSTWAGPVAVALSGEWRKTQLNITSTTSDVLADCAGINFNCVQGTTTYFDSLFIGLPAPVSQTVWETAGEVNVPLLKDVPFAREVNLNGAVRYTHYSTSGNYTTWKIGGDWHVDDKVTFRGTVSHDIRAPTLADLFAPRTVLIQTSADLLVRDPATGRNPSPTVPLYSQGNPLLKSELGRTYTAGIVWQPTPSLSFSLDGYHIEIKNAIVGQTGSGNAQQLECYASGGTSPLCQLQTRPLGFTNTTLANTVTSWTTAVVNYAAIKTYGVDFETNYRTLIAGHRLALRGLVTYQPHLTNETPIQARTDSAGATLPRVRLTAYASFDITPELVLNIQERWRSHLNVNINRLPYVNPEVPAYATTNLTLTYSPAKFWGRPEFYVSVQNLFDRDPEISGGSTTSPGQANGAVTGDDVIGRYYTVGIRARF